MMKMESLHRVARIGTSAAISKDANADGERRSVSDSDLLTSGCVRHRRAGSSGDRYSMSDDASDNCYNDF